MKLHETLETLIGHTPVLKLNKITQHLGIKSNLVAKLESFNPAGSVKDRAALYMIKDAEQKGLIAPGATVIEPTSGNTGIGLCAVCASKGYNAVIVMPDNMSIERINLMKAYGAKVVLTDGRLGMKGAIAKADEIAKNTPNSFVTGQFSNPSNAHAHYCTTAPELFDALDGKIDALVCGIGTGGTITGTAKYLKERLPGVKIFGVEPASSPFISEGRAGTHKLQGIGAGFVPEVLDLALVDQILTVTDEKAYEFTRLMARLEGVLVGISSGAALAGAALVASLPEFSSPEKTVALILPDSGERYLSVKGLF